MKKFFLSFLIVFMSFFLLTTNSFAQLPVLSIPGINCGVAGEAKLEQCCMVLHPTAPTAVSTGNNIVDGIVNFLYSAIPNLVLGKVQSFVDIQTKISKPCETGLPSTNDPADPACKCINTITPSPGYLKALDDFCQRQSTAQGRTQCLECSNSGGVFSAIGCVKTNLRQFISETVFGLGIGLAGGFSLLCIIYAAFIMQSSEGNPEKLKKAQEMLTSCVTGLMLIIFSVFILRLIGVNILRIPGFI
jgi:hypothetical protein